MFFRCSNILCSVLPLESSPEPENLEQSWEAVSLSDQTLPECLRLHRTALPAQVTSLLLLLGCLVLCGRGFRMTSSGVCVCFRQEADGKLYVRYQVIGQNHVAVPTHFFKVSSPAWWWFWWWWWRRWWCRHPASPQVLILEQTDGRGVELRSYVLPNEPIDERVPLERFLVPIETIERASGLLFVPNIMKRTSSLQAVTNRWEIHYPQSSAAEGLQDMWRLMLKQLIQNWSISTWRHSLWCHLCLKMSVNKFIKTVDKCLNFLNLQSEFLFSATKSIKIYN